MSETGAVENRTERYYREQCPIIPALMYKKGNEYNSTRFGISWLFFRVTDAMTPWPAFSIEISGARISFLYIALYICLPWSWKINSWSQQNFWRIGAKSKYKWMR